MIHYLFIFIFPFFMTNFVKCSKALENTIYFIFVIYLIIIVGFRFEMGLDWGNYIKEFTDRNFIYANQDTWSTFFKNLFLGQISDNRNIEPLYLLTLNLSNILFGNIIFFNVLNALLAIGCLSFFCFKQKNKWFGIVISVSFIIFYGMDIVRQFTALGFIFLMIFNLSKKNYNYSLIFLFISLCFHTSSIIFLTLYFYVRLSEFEYKYKVYSWIFLCLIISALIFLQIENISRIFINTYEPYVNKGLIFRLIIYTLPFLIFLFFKKKFTDSKYLKILNWYSAFIIILIFSLINNVHSTILDRFVVYLVPYQIIVYSHFIGILNFKKINNFCKLCISFFYVVFAMNWLFLSEDNFRIYIPYKNVLWEDYYKSQSVICNPLYKCRLEGSDNTEKYE
jgi:hypothetical protein